MEIPVRARLIWVALLTLCSSLPLVPTGLAQAQSAPAVDAKIEIVWPHDQQGNVAPVGTAPLVNVEVFLFQRGTLNPVPCSFSNTVTLHSAMNWEIYGQGHGIGGEMTVDRRESVPAQRTTRTVDGKTFPVWVFNSVPIGIPASTPYITDIKTFYFVAVQGADYRTNVWAHGADARTFAPDQIIPQQIASSPLSAVESWIQIVWPHDALGNQQAVVAAPLANIGVDLFRHPLFLADQAALAAPNASPLSVGFAFPQPVHLLQSLNSGYLAPVNAPPQLVAMTNATAFSHPVSWPRWLFNNVDVSAAQNPLNKEYFAVQVNGVENHTTIWAHGADARTYFPQRDVPASGGAGCA
jgi:hypothetical protein